MLLFAVNNLNAQITIEWGVKIVKMFNNISLRYLSDVKIYFYFDSATLIMKIKATDCDTACCPGAILHICNIHAPA